MSGIAAGTEILEQAVVLTPSPDDVLGDIRKEEIPAGSKPDGALGPVKAFGEDFERGAWGDKIVEGRVQPFDSSEGTGSDSGGVGRFGGVNADDEPDQGKGDKKRE